MPIAPAAKAAMRPMPPKARLLFVCVFSIERPKVLADLEDFLNARSSERRVADDLDDELTGHR